MVDPQHYPVEQGAVQRLGHGVTGGYGLGTQRLSQLGWDNPCLSLLFLFSTGWA
jgi:hypothetical protein